jgi:hypothetical protein
MSRLNFENLFDNKNMQATTPLYLAEEGFTSYRKVEVDNDPLLFAILTGMFEQTIRCRHLDVARAFRDAFIAKVDAVEPSCGASDREQFQGIADLFCRALEGKLQPKKAREAFHAFNPCDLMQRLFIQGNPNKTWLIERLNEDTPVTRDDEVIIPWFCKTFGIEICIYWLESPNMYERIEFFSPKFGLIVNIYQRQTELETETGLLYFANQNDQEVLEPRYPNCCLPNKLTRRYLLCSPITIEPRLSKQNKGYEPILESLSTTAETVAQQACRELKPTDSSAMEARPPIKLRTRYYLANKPKKIADPPQYFSGFLLQDIQSSSTTPQTSLEVPQALRQTPAEITEHSLIDHDSASQVDQMAVEDVGETSCWELSRIHSLYLELSGTEEEEYEVFVDACTSKHQVTYRDYGDPQEKRRQTLQPETAKLPINTRCSSNYKPRSKPGSIAGAECQLEGI